MAEEATGVLTQEAIDALFGEVPSGDVVLDPGTSADGITRASTVGDMPEVNIAPPIAAAPVAPAPPPLAPIAAVAPAMQEARPWIQPDPGTLGGGVDPATIAVLEQRIATIEAAVQRMVTLEASIAALTNQLGSGEFASRLDVQQLQGGVMRQMKSIMENLQATPGYGLKKTFKCSNCGDEHHVGNTVKCTNCQNESTVGWYPERGARPPQAGGQRRPPPSGGERRPPPPGGERRPPPPGGQRRPSPPPGGHPGGPPPPNGRRPPQGRPGPGRPPQ
ncbi:MAG: hypothetical protein HQ478_08465 [Chloroflexi bacterium]|nr:hypothetical protein [Chloroflexota bacterium]